MKLYDVAVKRPVTTVMCICALVFLGIVSYTRTSVDMFPAVNMPIAVISTSYQAGPEEVESIVTTNIETAVSRVPKVKAMQSTSSENSSLVVVQFQDDVDMDATLYKIGQYTDAVMSMMPDGVSAPVILSLDPTQLPVVQASVSHSAMSETEFYRFMESSVLPSLESTDGVASVSMSGGVQNQVQITVSQDKLNRYGFALTSIIQQLQADNVSLPGGMTEKGDINLNLKVDGKYQSLSEIENLTLYAQTGTKVRLGDIARVEMTNKASNSLFRSNGQPSIAISFQKESTANIIQTAKSIQQKLKDMEQANPGFTAHITQDSSTFISQSVRNVLDSAIIGIILAVMVLLFFLKDFKTSLIVGLAMPISIISTFTFLYLLGITINLLSLGGLTFAVGMLVDNSIIVLENIYRHVEMGENRVTAAIQGTKEISMAVFASTLTNIAIFLPIVFTGGMVGDWLSNLALTITVSMICSYVVAVMVIPMFASLFIRKTDKATILDSTSHHPVYLNALNACLFRRKLSVVTAVAFSLVSVVLAFTAGLEMMPEMNSNSFNVSVSLNHGTRLAVADERMTAYEQELQKLDYVTDYHTSVGGGMFGSDSSSASVTVNTKPLKQIDRSPEEISEQLQQLADATIPARKISVTNNGSMTASMGSSGSGSVTFALQGNDIGQLSTWASAIQDRLESQEYVKSVEHSYEEGLPYLSVNLDQAKAASFGLTTASVAAAIDTAQNGKVASRYALGGTEIDILVKTDTTSKHSLEELKAMQLQTAAGTNVPLSSLATLTEKVSPAAIQKTDKVKVVNFTIHLNGITSGQGQTRITEQIGTLGLPAGFTVAFTGTTEEMLSGLKDMLYAIFIGVVLIYMILAAQFESYKQPLIIMLSIPFSFTGGFLILGLFRMPLSTPVLMGMLMLVGIIVNNAILIVDTINTFRRENELSIVTAIRQGCLIRLRPMLLTTLTTVLGLVPMALGIGEGTKLLQPMAVFVMGGLMVGTLLTMVLVPVFYLITDKERKTDTAKQELYRKSKGV